MSDNTNYNEEFTREWTRRLLKNIGVQEETKTSESCFQSCADWHYEQNDMDNLIHNYIGNMPDFLTFLESEWGWKITVSEDGKVILIDEDKDFCVCPVAQTLGEKVPESLCCCSEAFASKMFSTVAGKEVKATVLRSWVRDRQTCVYEIRL